MALRNNYKLLIELGSGSFGSVWKIVDNKTGFDYAMKIEDKNQKSRLKVENDVYNDLKQNGITKGIPNIYKYFESNKKCFLIMDLLGKSLDNLLNETEKGFTINQVKMFGISIINLLEKIHNAGYIHRDIKPNNFLVGYTDNDLYIMDFGLSKKYIVNDKHIKMKTERSLTGTARYASINVHDGIEPSRRDDLESVGYMLLYFISKKLPWQGLKKEKNKSQIILIGEYKKKISLDELCFPFPNCFKEYLTYCRKLKFDETPNYQYLKSLF